MFYYYTVTSHVYVVKGTDLKSGITENAHKRERISNEYESFPGTLKNLRITERRIRERSLCFSLNISFSFISLNSFRQSVIVEKNRT